MDPWLRRAAELMAVVSMPVAAVIFKIEAKTEMSTCGNFRMHERTPGGLN